MNALAIGAAISPWHLLQVAAMFMRLVGDCGLSGLLM